MIWFIVKVAEILLLCFEVSKALIEETGKAEVSYDNVLDLISSKALYNQNICNSRLIINTMICGMYQGDLNTLF